MSVAISDEGRRRRGRSHEQFIVLINEIDFNDDIKLNTVERRHGKRYKVYR
jgi:hypothetical protein